MQTDGEVNWALDVHIPFGLVAEGGADYTILYSAREKARPYCSIGRARVEVVWKNGKQAVGTR